MSIEPNDMMIIIDAADCADIEIKSYSGRHMSGIRCLSATTRDTGSIVRFILEVAAIDFSLAERMGDSICAERIGNTTLYYFPMINLTDEMILLLKDGDEDEA